MMVMLLTAATSFASINLQKYSMYLTAGTATQGQTVDVTLSMKNDKAIATWQTTLALPEGITFVSAVASGTRYGEAAPEISSVTNADGTVTLLCEPDAAMTGTDGEVATIKLKVAASVAPGDYKLALNGAVFIDVAEKTWTRTDVFEANITVEESEGVVGDVNGDGAVDVADVQAILNAIAAGETNGAADVNGDGAVDVADVQAVLNIIAGA